MIKFYIYGFIFSLILAPISIVFLRKHNFGQYIRELGPKSHLAKSGIPTMGGVIFIVPLALSLVFMSLVAIESYLVISSVLLYGAVGLVDDLAKIRSKSNDGLSARTKMLFLFLATSIMFIFFTNSSIINLDFLEIKISNDILKSIVILFIALAVTNASNLSDGVDGLLASVTIVISGFFFVVSYKSYFHILSGINLLFIGSLMAYLFFNWKPAKIFMGDFGSLAIGGFIFANAILLDLLWYLPIFAIWLVIETLSVIIQVAYYKKTKKRFFKMAPFHHHLEHIGYSEEKVCFVAVAITLLGCFISYFMIF